MSGKFVSGWITPRDQEAETAELFATGPSRPPLDQFDPMKIPRWTLHMAVAWIMWGRPDEVREWWDAYREKCTEWKWHDVEQGENEPVAMRTAEIGPVSPASLDRMSKCLGMARQAPLVPLGEAIGLLTEKLRAGDVHAAGRLGERRDDIRSDEWDELEIEMGIDGEPDCARSRDGRFWGALAFPRESIMETFKPQRRQDRLP